MLTPHNAVVYFLAQTPSYMYMNNMLTIFLLENPNAT